MIDQLTLAALNFLLARAPWACERLRPFAGREARIAAPPFTLLEFRVDRHGMLEPAHGGVADVAIDLSADAPLLALGGLARVMSAARISGAVDFADALGFVFRHLDWDAEEDLSHLVGDVAAHRLAAIGRSWLAWQSEAGRRLAENAVEYLQHENRRLVSRPDMADHSRSLDELRTRLSAADSRVQALERGGAEISRGAAAKRTSR